MGFIAHKVHNYRYHAQVERLDSQEVILLALSAPTHWVAC